MANNWISFSVGMRFELPKKLNSADRKAIARLVQAKEVFESVRDGKGVDFDRYHLRDAADALESMANLCRRARASSKRR